MHVATLTAPVTYRTATLEPGEWLMDDSNAAALLQANGPAVRLRPFDVAAPEIARPVDVSLYGVPRWSILWVRPGGYGDLLMLTPFLAEAHRLGWRNVVSTLRPEALTYEPGAMWTCDYPIQMASVGDFGEIVSLDGLLEFHPDAKTVNAYELIARLTGLDVPEDRRVPIHVVTQEETDWAKAKWERTRRPRIAVQVAASAACRTWPHVAEFVGLCRTAGVEVVLCCGPKDEIETDIPSRDMLVTTGLGWRQSAALVSQCDAVVAPDSALTHLAAALHLPCVAVFGSFHWRLRTATYPLCRAVQGVAPCAPCCHQGRPSRWPHDMPCERANACAALASVSADRAWRELKKMLP